MVRRDGGLWLSGMQTRPCLCVGFNDFTVVSAHCRAVMRSGNTVSSRMSACRFDRPGVMPPSFSAEPGFGAFGRAGMSR
ncbi:hypothetical protein LP7551_00354 [Roseibium album]|nr:hypothetical protein LP7551_00354 [Roseibium album]